MITAAQAQLEILSNSEALARRVADWLLAAATAKDDGVFSVALSGGTTPRTGSRQRTSASNPTT